MKLKRIRKSFAYDLDAFGVRKLKIHFDLSKKDISIEINNGVIFTHTDFRIFYEPRTLILSDNSVLTLQFIDKQEDSYWNVEFNGQLIKFASDHRYRMCCHGVFRYSIALMALGAYSIFEVPEFVELGVSAHTFFLGIVYSVLSIILLRKKSLPLLRFLLALFLGDLIVSVAIVPFHIPLWLRLFVLGFKFIAVMLLYTEGIVQLKRLFEDQEIKDSVPESFMQAKIKDPIVGEWRRQDSEALDEQYHMLLTANGFCIISSKRDQVETAILKYSLEESERLYLYDQDHKEVDVWEYCLDKNRLVLKKEGAETWFQKISKTTLKVTALITENDLDDSSVFPSFKATISPKPQGPIDASLN